MADDKDTDELDEALQFQRVPRPMPKVLSGFDQAEQDAYSRTREPRPPTAEPRAPLLAATLAITGGTIAILAIVVSPLTRWGLEHPLGQVWLLLGLSVLLSITAVFRLISPK